MKKIFLIILSIGFMISLISCGENNKSSINSKAKGAETKYISIDPSEQMTFCESLYKEPTEKETIKDSALIASVIVLESKEYKIIESVEGGSNDYYMTVYTVKINEIFKNDNKQKNDTVKIVNFISSYNMESEAIPIELNQEYVLFANHIIDTETVEFSRLADYCLANPFSTIGVKTADNNWQFHDSFVTLSKNAKTTTLRGYNDESHVVLELKEKTLTDNMKNVIDKYK